MRALCEASRQWNRRNDDGAVGGASQSLEREAPGYGVHLDSATVSKGDIIRVGQRIGRVGATGLATGPHLHFGLYLHGKDIDPVAWRDMPQWLIAADSSKQ